MLDRGRKRLCGSIKDVCYRNSIGPTALTVVMLVLMGLDGILLPSLSDLNGRHLSPLHFLHGRSINTGNRYGEQPNQSWESAEALGHTLVWHLRPAAGCLTEHTGQRPHVAFARCIDFWKLNSAAPAQWLPSAGYKPVINQHPYRPFIQHLMLSDKLTSHPSCCWMYLIFSLSFFF